MDSFILRCTMKDHEAQNKPIEGICSDDECKASCRLFCVLCSIKYHKKCSGEFLTQEQIIGQLKEIRVNGLNPNLAEFHTLKTQIIEQLKMIETNLNKGIDNEKIDSLLKKPLTQSGFLEAYNLIKKPKEPSVDQDQIIRKLKDIRNWMKTGKQEIQKQEQIICNWTPQIIDTQSAVYSVACSKDNLIASAQDDGWILLWDPETGQRVGDPLIGHTKWVSSVSFSPDNRFLVSGSDDSSVRVWEISTGKQVSMFSGHKSNVRCVQFSPDGQFVVSGSRDKTISIWNFKINKQVSTPIKTNDWVKSLQISPDGKHILSGGDDKQLNITKFPEL